MNLVMWARHPRPVRMITAWTRTACRRSYYTFAHSKRFQAAIELVALVVLVNAALIYFNYWLAKQVIRCVNAHIEMWIEQAQNDR